MSKKRIAIFVIAYDAASTLAATIDRIPPDVMERIEEIFVIDDCSKDDTYAKALAYKAERGMDKLRVFRNPVNLRYGGNQKAGYHYAIARGFDIVVMLHADGQYAPEVLDQLLAPLETDQADMVFGSRMAEGGDPLKGGMPLYKFVGNKVLTWMENRILGMNLSEFHSGYRAYSCHALASLPIQLNSNEWHFDTEILIQYKEAGLRIAERPIPTYYGDEICHVNGIAYAFNCMKSAFAYTAHKWGWLHLPKFDVAAGFKRYVFKPDAYSSHAKVLEAVERNRPRRVLEVGTAEGYLTERMKAMGCEVVGIELDPQLAEQAAPHCSQMLVGDIESIDLETLGQFDMVLCADVLEHLRDPEATLQRLVAQLEPGGTAVVSLPNIAMWLWRVKLLLGRFEYEERGPMDRTHLRFYTQATGKRLIRQGGLMDADTVATPLPLPTVAPAFGPGRGLAFLHRFNNWLTGKRPTFFGYQFVYEAKKSRVTAVPPPDLSEQLKLAMETAVAQREAATASAQP